MAYQSLKVRVLPRYPISMEAGAGLAVSTSGGVVSLGLDYADMTPAETPLDRENGLLAILDSNGEYRKLSLDDLTDSLADEIPVLVGEGPPSNEIGEDGWVYFDTVNNFYHVKENGQWDEGRSVVGSVLVWQGPWMAATSYNVDAGVSSNGSSYIAVQPSIDIEPGVTPGWQAYWNVLAAAGDLQAANNLSDVESVATAFDNIKQAATTAYAGVVEFATNTETQTGTDADRAVTPAGLASRTATTSRAGIVELATTAETTTGTDTARAVTPAGVAASVSAAVGPLSPTTRAVNAQTGTSYTFVLSDAGKLCTFENVASVTVTVPPSSSVAFPIGTQIDLAALGAGQVTLAQGAGVTINSEDGKKKLTKRYSGGTLVQTGTDVWLLVGSLAT
jgi:hypothetical protein